MSRPLVDDAWVRRFHSGPPGAAALVCFPHAGGSASYFRPFSKLLSRHFQVYALQYPGRQDRLAQPPISSIADFAEEVFIALGPLLRQSVTFFGHSMGAMIAFEVAARMKERLDADPTALFVSARRAPSRHRDQKVHLLDDMELIEMIGGLGGTDVRILQDESVRLMVLPSLRSDYKAVDTYRYEPRALLGCPIVAMVGESDASVTAEEAQAWADHTTGSFAVQRYTGGHFFVIDHQDAIAGQIARQLLAPPAS